MMEKNDALRTIVYGLLFFFNICHALAQESERKNNLLLEVGGASIPYTLGYERILDSRGSKEFRLKAGFGLYRTLDCGKCSDGDAGGLERELEEVFSFEVLGLKGRKKGKFEYGLGLGITNVFDFTTTAYISARVGYRYINNHSGLNFGIGLNPSFKIFGYSISNRFVPYPGVKVGYAF